MNSEEQRVHDEAHAFVASLDRSSLGDLACKASDLRNADLMVRLDDLWEDNVGHEVSRGYLENIAEKVAAKLWDSMGSNDALERLYGELIFWRGRYAASVDGTKAMDWAQKFGRVSQSDPVFHPYYAVGLWDEDLVASLIHDNIDPMLALSLYGGG